MDPIEEEELETIPEKYRPISAWGYFWYSVLFLIPVIGWICLTVFALNGYSINRRSFSRSYFIVFFFIVILVLAFEILCLVFGSDTVIVAIQDALHMVFPGVNVKF